MQTEPYSDKEHSSQKDRSKKPKKRKFVVFIGVLGSLYTVFGFPTVREAIFGSKSSSINTVDDHSVRVDDHSTVIYQTKSDKISAPVQKESIQVDKKIKTSPNINPSQKEVNNQPTQTIQKPNPLTPEKNNENYIVDNSFLNSPNTKEIIIDITKSGSFDETFSQNVSNIFTQKGFYSKSGFFSSHFYKDQVRKQIEFGNIDRIYELHLYDHADYLLIGNYSLKYRVNDVRNDMGVGDFSYTLSLIDLKNGTIIPSVSLPSTYSVNGFDENDITRTALGDFLKAIKQINF